MCFNRHKWFSWGCSVLFFISAFFYLMLSFTFMRDEKNKLRSLTSGIPSPNNSSQEIRDVKVKQNNFPDKFKI